MDWLQVAVGEVGGQLEGNANTYEVVNLGASQFSLSINYTSFNVWVTYLSGILPMHRRIRFLYNVKILRALRFTSSYAFLNPTLSTHNGQQGQREIATNWSRPASE